MAASFATLVVYTQLLVATAAGNGVGLAWTDDDVAQGFAWDEAIVSFGVPDHDGDCLVEVDASGAPPADPASDDTLWAVAVPFTATGTTVSVGTILSGRDLPIRPGRYRLTFQARPGGADHAFRLTLTFSPEVDAPFAILKRGVLGTDHVLRRRARRL